MDSPSGPFAFPIVKAGPPRDYLSRAIVFPG